MRKLIILLMSFFIVIIGGFFLFITINSYITRERLYYIEDANLYIKTYFRHKDHSGYVLFGRHKDILLSDSIDFVKIHDRSSFSFLINYTNSDTIFIESRLDFQSKIKQKNFRLIYNINQEDSKFFYDRSRNKPITVKKPYWLFSIGDNFNQLLLKKYEEYSFEKVPLLE